jgi:hypothetical protein
MIKRFKLILNLILKIHTKRSLEKCSKNSSPSESDVGAENQDSEQIN